MASSDRRPPVSLDEISLTKFRVTLLVEGLSPSGSQGVKNGSLDIQMKKSGLSFTASIKAKDGNVTQWSYKVRKFPSDILADKSSWKVEKGKVIFDLVKKESISWESMASRGLDQAPSSSSEED